MKKTIMIIGAGLLQVPLIKTAKNMGLQVIVTDYNSEALGMKYADIPIVMSTRDIEGSVRVARMQNEQTPIHGVLTSGTDASMTVAAVANALGLPGIKYEDAEAATNKIKMRTRFRENGVPSPMFRPVWTIAEAKAACKELGFPLVIKPSDNMGARGVMLLQDKNDISDGFHAAKKASPSGEIIIEEYMEGDELSVDTVVYDGNVTFTGIADRIIEDLPFFIEKGHTMPSQKSEREIAEVKKVMQQGIKALGIKHGFAKGDIKITSKGVMIGELAARLSGGFMSTHTFPYSTGVDLMKGAIEIALGQEPGNLEPVKNSVSIERCIITKPGMVKNISGVDVARQIKHINEIYLNVGIGDRVVTPRSNVEKAGHIIATADTLNQAEQAIKEALETISFEIEENETVSWDSIRRNAREKMAQVCLVCNECNGEKCITGVPGMGGAGSGDSFRQNIRSFENYKVVTQVIHEVDNPDCSCNFLGKKIDMPILVAPITGTVTNMNGAIEEKAYARAVTVGACKIGTIAMVGDGASPEKYRIGLDAIRSAGTGIAIFKPRKNIDDILTRIKEAEAAGALAVGMDIDAIGFVTMKRKNQSTSAKSKDVLKSIIEATTLPFVVKGVLGVKDALAAVESGAQAIIVSNHGGRVLNQTPGTLDVLPEIKKAVGDSITIVADGGVRTGVDILKALALGADLVSIGRPAAIAAVGMEADGVEFYLKEKMNELKETMVLTGCDSLGKIREELLLKLGK